MIRAVTTSHIAGWRLYGQRMARSWAGHWPVPLTVYTERFDCKVAGVGSADLTRIGWLRSFKVNHPYRMRGRYNYRFDAPRFAHKVAAVLDAASKPGQWLIWCDADTVTHGPVPQAFVESLLPRGDEYIAWLDREGNYPECGFYILNLAHPRHAEFIAAWRALYVDATIFHMPEWHDSFVLQQLIERMGMPTKSLSGDVARRTSHPFVNGPLGAYMDHMKGPRKQQGISRKADLKVERNEPYWSGAK